MREKRNTYRVFWGKPETKRLFCSLGVKKCYNNHLNLKEEGERDSSGPGKELQIVVK